MAPKKQWEDLTRKKRSKMSKDNKDQEKVEQEIELIIENARTFGRELTFTQASAIRYRSIKLKQESKTHPTDNPKEKIKQIEECWRQRNEGKV